jgi:hypothetical protein
VRGDSGGGGRGRRRRDSASSRHCGWCASQRGAPL